MLCSNYKFTRNTNSNCNKKNKGIIIIITTQVSQEMLKLFTYDARLFDRAQSFNNVRERWCDIKMCECEYVAVSNVMLAGDNENSFSFTFGFIAKKKRQRKWTLFNLFDFSERICVLFSLRVLFWIHICLRTHICWLLS